MKQATYRWLSDIGAPVCLVALVLSAAIMTAAGEHDRTPPIVIGMLLSTNQLEAASLRQGATLGIEHVNRSAARAKLVIRAQAGQWGNESNAAAELALDEAVDGLISPSDGAVAHQILQVAGRTRIPVVSLCPDSSVTSAGVPWAARIVPRTQDEAQTIFQRLASARVTPTPRHWAALVPSGRAGREVTRDLKAAAAAAGQDLAQVVSMDASSSDAPLHELLAASTEGILLWTPPALAGQLAKRLRHDGFRGVMAGPGTLDSPAFAASAGDAGEGLIVAVVMAGACPAQRAFNEEYRARFGSEPDTCAVMAHDAVLVLANLRSDASSHSGASLFHDQIAGVSGLISFDPQGNRMAQLELLCWSSGRLQRSLSHAEWKTAGERPVH
jgi:ABC-type branched-subunit amino acid transport system substrate-binding protein